MDAAARSLRSGCANLPYLDGRRAPARRRSVAQPSVALYADEGGAALVIRLLDGGAVPADAGGVSLLEVDPSILPAVLEVADRHSRDGASTRTWRRERVVEAIVLSRRGRPHPRGAAHPRRRGGGVSHRHRLRPGAAADDEVATKRVYRIKGRPVGMPLILMVAAESQLEGCVHIDSRTEAYMRRWWPGPLTLVLHAQGGGTLGVRIPEAQGRPRPAAAAGPLLTTSANLHGKDPAMTAEEAGELPGPRRRARRRQSAGRDGLDRARPHRPGAARAARRRDLDPRGPGAAALHAG